MDWPTIFFKALGLYALMGVTTYVTIKYITEKD
jgi:hypothetical protein